MAQTNSQSGLKIRGHVNLLDPVGGERVLAEVKSFAGGISSGTFLRRWLDELRRAGILRQAGRLYLCTTFPISQRLRAHLPEELRHITIWDRPAIEERLRQYPKVQEVFSFWAEADESAIRSLREFVTEHARASVAPPSSDTLCQRLRQLPAGRLQWGEYEKLATEMMGRAFAPHLRMPESQKRSDDGLDRYDALFPVQGGTPFWDDIKYNYASRSVVAEFKNYTKPIGQKEVESLQQYLFPAAKRSVGFLCSRKGPNAAAKLARRRAWILNKVLILFLDDDDLVELLDRKKNETDPAALLDEKMDEFFETLVP